jgi:arylsulfatase A-like enzyme
MKKSASLYLFLLFCLLGCKVNESTKSNLENSNAKKPNIVFILTDQWRSSSLGYAGNKDVKTPNLDAFAKESINFTNAVSVTPVCTPQRAALLTGKFPTTTGMIVNDIYLPEQELTMAEIYKTEGYSTAYWGKWHLDGHGRTTYIPKERRQGFDFWRALECSHEYNKMPYYDTDNPQLYYWEEYSPFAITKDVNKYLEKHANDKNPFLAVISIATPHYPHNSAPNKYKEMYPQNSLTLNPNVPEEMEKITRKELQGYYAHATATDEAIGNVLAKIKELNLLENTIIVFTADHGEMMGAHGVKPFVKQLAWNESIGVPFLIRFPKIGNNKGKKINAPLNTPDILPTLLGLSNIKIPKDIQGENLTKLIYNPNPETDRVALVMNAAPFGSNFGNPEYRAIRTKQYTYGRTLKGPNMFFDNIKDPYQMNNLVGNPEFVIIQKELDEKLMKSLKNIGDEFQPRDFYLKKWNYIFDEKKKAVPYWENDNKVKRVQSPKPYK